MTPEIGLGPRWNADAARRRLLGLVRERALEENVQRTLTSGKPSTYYLDGKQITCEGEGLFLAARLILDILRAKGLNIIGGMSLGADPIAAAVATVGHLEGYPVRACLVRKEPKKHGKMLRIEGPLLTSADAVVVVDDVVTTGGSTLQAIDAIVEVGAKVVLSLAIVDRQEGGPEALRARGIPFQTLFTVAEVRGTAGKSGL